MTADDSLKVAVVTGASQGIGAGIVEAFRNDGYAVVGTSRSIPPSDEADFLTLQGDISEVEVAQMIVDQAVDRFGRVDTLINNAGIFISKPFTDYSVEDYQAITSVNLTGFFHITQAVVRQMLAQGGPGHVVNISSSLVDHAESQNPSGLVALTKGGLAAATRSLAIEYTSARFAVQCGRPRRHPESCLRPSVLRGPRTAPSAGPRRQNQRCGRGNPLSRAGVVRHRSRAAHRRGTVGRRLNRRDPTLSRDDREWT